MMRRFLDRMMRPRDLVMKFRRVSDWDSPAGITGIFTTSQAPNPDELDRLRSLNVRNFIDGQIVRIPRSSK